MGDYDFEPKQAKNVFLRLKDKGQSVTVRIASAPYREPKVWKEGETRPMADENAGKLTQEQWARIMGDPQFTVNEVFHWIVIDREDGQARIFTGTPGIYKKIKEYAQMSSWGDPTKYDVQITRTEEPGPSYYTVVALPDKSDLTADEKKLIDSIDIKEKIPNARALSDTQIDNIDDFMSQAAPKATAPTSAKQDQQEDVVIEDIGDEPISLDDIPF